MPRIMPKIEITETLHQEAPQEFRSGSRRVLRGVQFALDTDVAAENGDIAKRSRISRSRSIGDSQKTLTQIAFVRQDSDLSTISGSRKRKRRVPNGSDKAQTTITQMPLVRSYNSMSEVVDHLGYGSHSSDDEHGESEAPQAAMTLKSTRTTAPIPDSEDEGEDFDLYIEQRVAKMPNTSSNIFSAASPLRPNRNPVEDLVDGLQRSSASTRLYEDCMQTPQRTQAIASSQSPVLTPLSVKRGQSFNQSQSASRSPSTSRLINVNLRPTTPDRSSLRRSPRNVLQPLTSNRNNIPMSPNQRQRTKTLIQTIEKIDKAARRPIKTMQRPQFIASSTKVSSSSSLDCEEGDDELDSDNRTMQFLDRPSLKVSRMSSPTASQVLDGGIDEASESTSVDRDSAPEGCQTLLESVDGGSEKIDRLRTGKPDSQDEASAQLLLETQACFERSDDIVAARIPESSCDNPSSSLPAIRPSQATTVGTSPARSTQRFVRFDNVTGASMQPLMPSSPMIPNRSGTAGPITSFDTDTTINQGNSSPSLHRPSSIGFESSPVLQQSHSRSAPCDDSQMFSVMQLPPSYLGESIPPPPLWSDE